MVKTYPAVKTIKNMDAEADLMESIENFIMSSGSSLDEIAEEIGIDYSQIDMMLSENTLDFSLGGLICYVSKSGNKTLVSVQ